MAMTTQDTTIPMRRCIGSTRFGIEAHETPENEFPVQPSAKDGLGRMCRRHWTAYTRALRKASVAREGHAGPRDRSPGSSPPRHTSGPGRESGVFVRPAASDHLPNGTCPGERGWSILLGCGPRWSGP